MLFYDISPNAFPAGAQYYFDVLVYNIAIIADDFFENDLTDIWYLERVTDAQPIVFHFFKEEEFNEDDWDLEDECEDFDDVDYGIQVLHHQVVEVHPDLGVSLYDMTDYETRGIWGFD